MRKEGKPPFDSVADHLENNQQGKVGHAKIGEGGNMPHPPPPSPPSKKKKKEANLGCILESHKERKYK